MALQSKLKINHGLFAFSEFFRDSSKKNELFFDFAARKFGSLLTYSCFDYAAECGEQGLNDTAPFEYKSCTIHDAAFLMLVFFTELPVKHRALGIISAYRNRFLTFEQEHFNRISIKLKI